MTQIRYRTSRRKRMNSNSQFAAHGSRGVFVLIEPRIVVEVEKEIDLRIMYFQPSRKICLAHTGFQHGAVKL